MTRVIHTGDTHVGYQQYHSPERRRDFLDAFEQVVDDALTDDVDAVVHAGDLFHDRRPDLQDLLGVLDLLRRLDDADVPFLAIVGNHEATRGGQWLDLFERLGLATRLDETPHVIGDVAFYGLDHVPKSRRDELDYRFEPHDAAYAAVVAHGLFTPFAHADWDTEEVLEAATVDFDAMLLGDNHVPDTAEVDDTWVTYCGSTERTSTDEEAGRGYNIVSFTGADGVDVRRRGLDTRPFVFVDVELAADEGGDRVREQVRQHDLEDAVVVVDVIGEGDPITPASIEEAALDGGALVARVRDRRELEDGSDLSVSFADPDEAVRERVGELGLSQAALDVDETIRASKVADANVREAVTDRVESLLDEPGAFERATAATADGEPAASDGTTAPDDETPPDDASAADERGETGRTAEADESVDAADRTDDVDRTDDADRTDADDRTDEPASAGADDAAESTESPDATDSSTPPEQSETDGQASMEEYL